MKEFNERLGAAIENAAENLPEGWDITLAIEKGAGVATLRDPHGNDICGGEYDGDDLAETIENAIAFARVKWKEVSRYLGSPPRTASQGESQ